MSIRKLQVLMIAAFMGVNVVAQEPEKEDEKKSENLNREMTLERDYDPIIQDAAKVNTLPIVREMTVSKRPIEYSDYATPIIPEKEMRVLPPGTMNTEIEHIKKNGYLHFGGGMLMNFSGDLGYRAVNTEKDILSLHFSHRSSNGNVEFSDATLNKRKAKLNDNSGGIDYSHQFDAATLFLGGNVGISAFNYYGMPTNLSLSSLPTFNLDSINDTETNQIGRNINIYAGVKSKIPEKLGYHLGVNYTNFNQKYSLSKDLKGMTENNIGIDFGLNSPVKNDQCFGVDASLNILSYTEPEKSIPLDSANAAFKSRFDASLSPYYKIDRGTWNLLLGAKVSLVSQDDNTDVFVSPNIAVNALISKFTQFYLIANGGIESNTMSEVSSRTNRYINPAFTPDASKTWADAKIGISGSPAAGFWFDVFAGFKYTEADLFFNPSMFNRIDNGFNNVSVAYQPTSTRIQGGVTLKYDYQQIADFYIRGVYYGYSFKQNASWKNDYTAGSLKDDEIKPFGKPAFVAEAGINIRPIKPLTLSLNYSMLNGAYYFLNNKAEKMGTVNDLRFRASWKFNDTFSVYAQANNLLFQKQEVVYGYPLQPFTAMGGFNINF